MECVMWDIDDVLVLVLTDDWIDATITNIDLIITNIDWYNNSSLFFVRLTNVDLMLYNFDGHIVVMFFVLRY